MKICNISVKNLFGMFNHNIPIRLADRITIVHGPNGFGKTALLRLVHDLFSAKYTDMRQIEFESFSVGFDDNTSIQVERHHATGRNLPQLIISKWKKDKKQETYPVTRTSGRAEQPYAVEHMLPLERVTIDTWRYLPTQELMDLDEIYARFGDSLPSMPSPQKAEPDWLKKLRVSIPVSMIATQRLFDFRVARNNSERMRESERRPSFRHSVESYSSQLSEIIRANLAEYATLSQSLDRTFPKRLVEQDENLDLTVDQLRANLLKLEEKRQRLISAGLLDKESGQEFQTQVDDRNRRVLTIYVSDVERKLSVFDNIASKIDLLTQIINDRFLYKTISISKEHGFIFTTWDKKPLSPIQLSSGEQHEIVLFYELLFKVQPNSFLLVDEPEISLHVAWQERFLKDLQRTTLLSSFDALVATHSPQIISDRWDLTEELKGPVLP